MHVLQQEIEVWYIIPSIRRELANCLVFDYEMSYEKTGKFLGITKAAVSQYIGSKRAVKVKLPKIAIDEINRSCKKIVNEKSDSVTEITKILKFIRDNKLKLEICDKHVNGVFENCKEMGARR